ncbi:hypothetical protein GDO81_003023 [Engystomops pustulosus]|uniref:Uncharacterized protein n=1 Tax=Engystomops pustulosus TaxID=76066 RepID=A0AAV6ZYU7_ENGPU|nr:hypothetical protein GDO81_003023 [Engystomops pustulosus]
MQQIIDVTCTMFSKLGELWGLRRLEGDIANVNNIHIDKPITYHISRHNCKVFKRINQLLHDPQVGRALFQIYRQTRQFRQWFGS